MYKIFTNLSSIKLESIINITYLYYITMIQNLNQNFAESLLHFQIKFLWTYHKANEDERIQHFWI
jgi:hypothetical protein